MIISPWAEQQQEEVAIIEARKKKIAEIVMNI